MMMIEEQFAWWWWWCSSFFFFTLLLLLLLLLPSRREPCSSRSSRPNRIGRVGSDPTWADRWPLIRAWTDVDRMDVRNDWLLVPAAFSPHGDDCCWLAKGSTAAPHEVATAKWGVLELAFACCCSSSEEEEREEKSHHSLLLDTKPGWPSGRVTTDRTRH